MADVVLYYQSTLGREAQVKNNILTLKEGGLDNIITAAEVIHPRGFNGWVRIDAKNMDEYHDIEGKILGMGDIIKTETVIITNRFILYKSTE